MLRSRPNTITPKLSFLTFENPIVAAIVAIRIGRNEDYVTHDKGSLLAGGTGALWWSGKGRWMALDTNTFLMVLVAAIVVMGVVIWVMLKKAG